MSIVKSEQYIGGRLRPSASSGCLEVIDPYRGEVIARVPRGHRDDVDAAVDAARRAFPAWGETSPARRKAYLKDLLEQLITRREAAADVITAEIGVPRRLARTMQLDMPIGILEATLAAMDEIPWVETIGHSGVLREPIGVVAAVTPWNVPLHQIMAKLAPALAAGCTLVLKPSEVSPLSAYFLAELVDAIGLPEGVFNLVCGDAEAVAKPLVAHPGVDMVSFTGSVEVGKAVMSAAAANLAKVNLELGGKSVNLMAPGTDPEKVAAAALRQCWTNAGQICVSHSRLLVPRSEQEALCERLLVAAVDWTLGDPNEETTWVGPLATRGQFHKARDYMIGAEAEGAVCIVGGSAAVDEEAPGNLIPPTIYRDVTPTMRIAQEETFAPILTVMPYDDLDEAVAIANQLPLGLSGSVWAPSHAEAVALAKCLRTGQVFINGAPPNFAAPFGGYKQSGIGREYGRYGIEEYFELKSIHGY